MILSDREIELALDQKRIIITPRPDPLRMDSTSVDLRLAGILDQWHFPDPDVSIGQGASRFCPGRREFRFSDVEKKYTIGWTLERIYLPHTSRLCARVEGKSSLGRMGLGVHVTAPTIHAGFGHNAQNSEDHGASLRLEIWNVGPLPVELLTEMRICQLIVEEVREVPKAGYSGLFNLQGPTPSGQ
jgi:dCTP deaminase